MVYRPQSRIFIPAAATTTVLSLLQVKEHLRIDADYDDSVVEGIALAAEAMVEKYTQRLLTVRTCTLKLPSLPTDLEPIELPGGTVQALTSVMVDGSAVTGCTIIAPNLLVPASAWGAVTGENYPVTITYTAGYTAVPTPLKHAAKVIAADLYETRTSTGSGAVMPFAAMALIAPYRIIPT